MHTLGNLVPTEHHLHPTAYLSNVADHVKPFINTVYPSFDVLMVDVLMAASSKIPLHAKKLKTS